MPSRDPVWKLVSVKHETSNNSVDGHNPVVGIIGCSDTHCSPLVPWDKLVEKLEQEVIYSKIFVTRDGEVFFCKDDLSPATSSSVTHCDVHRLRSPAMLLQVLVYVQGHRFVPETFTVRMVVIRTLLHRFPDCRSVERV